MGPYGPIWAPTRTGPQPGLGPNPDWAPTRSCSPVVREPNTNTIEKLAIIRDVKARDTELLDSKADQLLSGADSILGRVASIRHDEEESELPSQTELLPSWQVKTPAQWLTRPEVST